MPDLRMIQDVVPTDQAMVGTWPASGQPLGVLVELDGRRWMVYEDKKWQLGWVTALMGDDGQPVSGSELWIPLLDGEAGVPLTWWRHFCDASEFLPEYWNLQAPPPATELTGPATDGRQRFVVVANRLPVEVIPGDAADPAPRWRTSPGGLVSAVEPVMQGRDAAWVGWTGLADSRIEPFDVRGMNLIPVELSAAEVADFYDGFSNGTLWPLYHDAIVEPRFDQRWWRAYVQVNRRFAATAASRAAVGAAVWVHDYQLQLVPTMLRDARPDLRIGFFNHIPFPGREIYAQLPWRTEILHGILGADLIGFQRHTDASNFLRACRRWAPGADPVRIPAAIAALGTRHLSAGGRSAARVGTFPISIDVPTFEALARRPDVQARARQIRAELGDPPVVILSVDRLDYTKGILQRLRAYEQLLQQGSMGPPRAVLVQIATPTRERVLQYQTVLQQVEAIVGRINGEYGTMGQPAVRYLHHSYPRDELAALYLAADVMLVTSLRDGMNLVAKEYIACRIHDDGVLVLSEFTGAADELTGAIIINPHDRDATKNAIVLATEMPADQVAHRMRQLRRQVRSHDVHHWATTFLTALQRDQPTTAPQQGPLSRIPDQPTPPHRQHPAGEPMNSIPIVEELTAQHVHIAGLLRRIELATGPDRIAAFDEFRGYLAAHEAAEEEFVHPAARTGQGGVVEQRLAEEHRAGTLIAEMEALDVDAAEFDVKFGQLHRAVTEHAAHEEEQEFPHLTAVGDPHTLIRMRLAIKLVSSLAARTIGTGKSFTERVDSDREHLRGTADATM